MSLLGSQLSELVMDNGFVPDRSRVSRLNFCTSCRSQTARGWGGSQGIDKIKISLRYGGTRRHDWITRTYGTFL